MRAAIWFVSLFAVAVAMSIFLGAKQGVVTLFWPPYRVDLSLNLVMLLWVLSVVALYVILRSAQLLVDLPQRAQRWRSLQKERTVQQGLLQAMFELSSGRYLRAQKSAQKALALLQDLNSGRMEHALSESYLSELECMLHLLYAEAAHCLRDQLRRDAHFEKALSLSRSLHLLSRVEPLETSHLLATRWHLSDKDPHAALSRLAQLSSGAARRTVALRLRLKAARLSEQNEFALETAKLLAKHGAFTANVASTLLKSLIGACLSEAKDEAQLLKLWGHLETKERQIQGIGLLAAERLLSLKGSSKMAKEWLIHDSECLYKDPLSLTPELREQLVLFLQKVTLALAPNTQDLNVLEQAVRLHPQVVELQYLYAQTCVHHGLWGKAQQLLELLIPRNVAPSLKRRSWIALAQLMEQKEEHAKALELWRRAALLLH
ncbi:MAG: heme biosynthesis HemY N-terminal domain-containing protein [Betaproteobacteria bacterium]|jgi:HemY protein